MAFDLARFDIAQVVRFSYLGVAFTDGEDFWEIPHKSLKGFLELEIGQTVELEYRMYDVMVRQWFPKDNWEKDGF